MLPIPVQVAASGFEMLVWLIVGIIWLIFQGLASAAKKKLPPDEEPHPTLQPPQLHPENTQRDELRELIETITGQKPPMTDPGDEEEEPPALPRPAPKPVQVRPVVRPPTRFSQPVRKFTPPPSRPVMTPAVALAPPEPPPTPMPARAAEPHLLSARAETTSEALRLAPLLKMKWPRSQFQRLAGAARRAAPASRLKHQLTGQAALRQAMISRIVLGPPGGR